MSSRYPGCYGIHIEPAELGLELGYAVAPPPRAVRIEVLDSLEIAPAAALVWTHEEPASHGYPPIRTEAWREHDDAVWWTNHFDTQLRVDYANAVVAIASHSRAGHDAVLEALASIGLPMFAQLCAAYVLHGSAASRDGAAVLITAPGGSGKSTLAAGLVSQGWEAISEDQCVIDTDGTPVVWPGPSWVRLLSGSPARAPIRHRRFTALDKVTWDLGPWMCHEPTPLRRLVVLEPPGGTDLVWERIPPADVIPLLGSQSTWMDDGSRFAASVFAHAAALALSVPAYRMRIPRHDGWLDDAIALIDKDGTD